jgi:short-subunit dehydrogenase
MILRSRKQEELEQLAASLDGEGHRTIVSDLAKDGAALALLAEAGGLRGFALCLRDDLRPTGVGVSVVCPGAIRDAGMFAESGASPPPLIGTGTPEQVGDAVVTVIERNRGEIDVAPLRQRALARFAVNAPELASRLAGDVATRAADQIAAGQTDKR